MIHKLQHGFEAVCLLFVISWQPFFGIIASIAAISYYVAMLKMNVIDAKFGGSWKRYIKSIFGL